MTEIPARGGERGVSLVMVALALVALLAAASLAIDLGMLYVARSQAQQAADAAALAGASALANSNCITALDGCVAGGSQETGATTQAEAAGAQNYVMGQRANIHNSDVSFNYPNPQEPQITVAVQRTVARGNAIPTLLARVFGVNTVNVVATATAEAVNPSGGSVPVDYGCVAPFLVPNCDPNHLNVPTGNVNGSCDDGQGNAGYFINPTSLQLENTGPYSSGGVVGEPWQLHSSASPSQWYLVAYNSTLASGISSGYGNGNGQSASLLRQYISECAPQIISCGSTVNTFNGKSVGPTDQGTDARINASGNGLGKGQDTINTSIGPPFPITGGANNPNSTLVGQTYYGPSPSELLVPVYGGQQLNPGGDTAPVIGFMQIFIQDAIHSGTDSLVDVVILKVITCASGGNGDGTTPAISEAGGMAVPVRLIRTQ
ncbi:MAG TPA: pilus assembly protein TadG-related protein [Candidatus Dormibacteraeota bacterium]|nr:pilus assembly protein TadG-related protein [Candidatus Dormibacteraeota bacterium]